jgi:hypothetical protein
MTALLERIPCPGDASTGRAADQTVEIRGGRMDRPVGPARPGGAVAQPMRDQGPRLVQPQQRAHQAGDQSTLLRRIQIDGGIDELQRPDNLVSNELVVPFAAPDGSPPPATRNPGWSTPDDSLEW